MSEKKIVFRIDQMTCQNCEQRLEYALKKLNGVHSVIASNLKKTAVITFDDTCCDENKLILHIKQLGYTASRSQQAVTQNNPLIFILTSAGIIVLLFILNKSALFNYFPSVDDSMSYGVLFTVGMLTSLHCIAMCGGINLSQSIKRDTALQNRFSFRQLTSGVYYNSGRVASYTIIGGIVGAIGSVISISREMQTVVIAVAGVFMILLGFQLFGLPSFLTFMLPRLPQWLRAFLYSTSKENNKSPFIVGFLNGFLPCGPLQTMQLYALGTGSFYTGALSMMIFSLGTIPLMLAVSISSTFLTRKFAAVMVRASGVLIIFLGLTMMSRSFALSGNSLDVNDGSDIKNIALVKDSVQYVQSKILPDSYEPIIIQKGIPVVWTMTADSGSLNGCNKSIQIPQLNITKELTYGENIIRFTPQSSGTLTFTCWMAMIHSKIRVVDDISRYAPK